MSRGNSPLRDRVIFLVGARRSGTNWLQRVVGAHPDVAVVPSETYLFSRGIAPLRARFAHGLRGSTGTGFIHMDERDLLDGLRDFCDRALGPFLEGTPAAKRLAERTPEHVMCLGLIGEIYPDAHIVHIVRDGRDVVRSLLSQEWASAPRTVEEAAREWRTSVEAGVGQGALLENYRTVQYERMLADPLREVTALYGSLGLRAGPAVVEAALVEAEVRFNVDTKAPHVATGKWRETFSEEDTRTFMEEAGSTLAQLGYDVSAGPATGTPIERPKRTPRQRRIAPAKPSFRKRSKGSGPSPDPEFERRVTASVTTMQHVFDRVVGSVTSRRFDELASLTTPSVWVRFVGISGEWKGRGPVAWDRLVAEIERDEAFAGKQIRGDIHVAVPTSVVFLSFVTRDGRTHVRVISATFQGEHIARATFYQVAPSA